MHSYMSMCMCRCVYIYIYIHVGLKLRAYHIVTAGRCIYHMKLHGAFGHGLSVPKARKCPEEVCCYQKTTFIY